jgi:negative regulator of sigma E activity
VFGAKVAWYCYAVTKTGVNAMAQRNFSPQQAQRHAECAATQAKPWITKLGRLGYAAKGMVYGLVGVLAVQAALGQGGQTTDAKGVLQTIAQAPFGRVLLALVALGLLGHAVWRFVQAIMDTENKGSDAKGLGTRAAYAGIGVVYVGLALAALRLVLGSGGTRSSDQSTQDWTARLLAQPSGRWLVALVGLIVIGVGLYQFYRAYSAKFREKLNLSEMSPTEETWATRIGRVGFTARGVVFGIIGVFLLIAALQAQPQEARGLAGALQTLAQQQPYGPWLLGIVALGFVAYGLFMLVQARYRRMVITS